MASFNIISLLKRYGWVINFLLIAFGAYFVAGAANAVVARTISMPPTATAGGNITRAQPTGQQGPGLSLESIANRNLLEAKREQLTPVTVETAPTPGLVSGSDFDEASLKPCTIPGQLRATMVADDAPDWSIAVIYNNAEREAQVYSINEGSNAFADDAVVVAIRTNEVVVRRRDHFERCGSDEGGAPPRSSSPLAAALTRNRSTEPAGDGVRKVGTTEYEVDRSEVDDALNNLSKVATQARIVPSFKNGKANGFKLFSIKPGSIFSKIGLKNGDVIQKINGYEMNSPDKALELYQKLRNVSSLSIDIQRRGQNQSMQYNIK